MSICLLKWHLDVPPTISPECVADFCARAGRGSVRKRFQNSPFRARPTCIASRDSLSELPPPPRLPRAHPPSTPNTRPTRIIDASSTLECTFILSSCKSWNYCQPLGASQAWRIPIPIGRSLILSPPLPFELFLPGPLRASNTFKQPPCTTAHDIVRDAGRSSHLHENKSLDTTSSLLVAESVTVAQHGRSSPNAGFAKERQD